MGILLPNTTTWISSSVLARKLKKYGKRTTFFALTWRNVKKKGKAVPLRAWSGPEGSRKLRFPDFVTTAQEGGKVVSLKHRPHLPPGNPPGTHFCYSLSRPQGLSAIGRYMSMKNSNDTIWDRTRDLPICSTVP